MSGHTKKVHPKAVWQCKQHQSLIWLLFSCNYHVKYMSLLHNNCLLISYLSDNNLFILLNITVHTSYYSVQTNSMLMEKLVTKFLHIIKQYFCNHFLNSFSFVLSISKVQISHNLSSNAGFPEIVRFNFFNCWDRSKAATTNNL